MGSFSNKAFAEYFKRILQVNQSSNTGCDATTRDIESGDGAKTAIKLSDDVLEIRPQSDNTTGTLKVSNASNNTMFAVDTTNEKVLIGRGQVSANTQYAHFGSSYADVTGSAGFAADTHYALQFNGMPSFSTLVTNIAMGSSTSSSFNDTNPATSLIISNTAQDMVQCYWYVMDNITIDAVKWLHSADAATGDSTAAHLMAYDVDIANGSTGGDLSNGTVVADGATITNAGYEQIYYQAMTIQSANVDAGKVILFTFASDTNNSDYSVNATVKFSLR